MLIYFRCCEKQETSGLGRRWKGFSKVDILKKCWLSLQNSIKPDDEIVFIADHVSEKTMSWLHDTAKTQRLSTQYVPDHVNDPSESFKALAKALDHFTGLLPNHLHYICEDDYLHTPHALDVIKQVYADGWDGFLLPYDYPDRYTLDRTRTAEVFINGHCHWRTVPSGTGSSCAKGKTWRTYMTIFHQAAHFNTDSFTWHAYANTPCICPIPGVSTHLTEGCLTPHVDWEAVWNSIEVN
jgi:hypothetical protein